MINVKGSARPKWLHWWILTTLKKEIIPVLHRLFIGEEGKLTHFLKQALTWYQIQTKALQVNHSQIVPMYIFKNSLQNINKSKSSKKKLNTHECKFIPFPRTAKLI